MKSSKINYISILSLIVLLGLLYYYLFRGSGEAKYGKPANAIRERVKVPVIESYMRKIRLPNNVVGGRWESKDDKDDVTHLWKTVSPYNGSYLLHEEADAFKKSKDKESYWQLNIYSTIIGDSVSARKGLLRLLYNGSADTGQNLDENGLDSICIAWGVKGLVKGNGSVSD